jgi:hypothetical protein
LLCLPQSVYKFCLWPSLLLSSISRRLVSSVDEECQLLARFFLARGGARCCSAFLARDVVDEEVDVDEVVKAVEVVDTVEAVFLRVIGWRG